MTEETTGALEELSHEECMQLVKSRSVGRIAVGRDRRAPLVVPVNYIIDGDAIVFRTDPGTKLDALRHEPVSFQVDAIDPFHRTGWSVLVEGEAYEAVHWEVDHLVVDAWAGGQKRHWVRIRPTAVRGRRIRLPLIEVFDDHAC